MKATVLNKSLILKKPKLVVQVIPIDKVQKHILTTFPGASPTINKFSDILNFTLGDAQFSVVVQNSVIALSADVGEVSHDKEMLQLAQKLNEEFAEFPLEAVGLNFKLSIEDIDEVKLHSYFKLDSLVKNGLVASESITVPVISFVEHLEDSKQRAFVISLFQQNGKYLGNGEAGTNLHIELSELPEYSTLSDQLTEEEASIKSKLSNFA